MDCKTELLKLQKEQFQKTIAIIGRTGSGKSSLLNALLNQENFLPVSQASACTAVAVEISANFANLNYEADIEFLSKDDWESELNFRQKLNDDFRPERLPYNSKLVEDYEPVSDLSAEDFIEKISHYMSVGPKEVSDLDPDDEIYEINDCDFVKCIKIRIPNSDICSCGITLVDLPGKGDMHVVRNRIASEYVQKCNAIWIVSPIARAMSDDIQTIIDEEFFQKLVMESRYGILSFICTKTDEIDTNQYIKEMKLQKDPIIEPLVSALKEIEKNMSETEKRKKQLNKDPSTNAADIQECTNTNLLSLGKKCECDRQLKEICIKHRNQYSRTHLERILKLKLSKMVVDKQLTDSQNPNVFCVSSKDYNELHCCDDEALDDHTGISELANHEKTTINLRIDQFREGVVRRLYERMLMIVNSLSDPVTEDSGIQNTAKQIFLANKDLLRISVTNIQNERMDQIREKHALLNSAVDKVIPKSVENTGKIVEGWKTSYSYKTYEATIRRLGEYWSRSKVGKVDLNWELCGSFNVAILSEWIQLFEIPVQELNKEISEAVKVFHSRLKSELSTALLSMYETQLPSCTDLQIQSGYKRYRGHYQTEAAIYVCNN